MIRKEKMQVHSSTVIAKDSIELVLKNNYISRKAVPGQFLHISIPNHTLRRPISIADVNVEEGTVTLIFKVIGLGTKQLATLSVGDHLDVLGPSGNGFDIESIQKEETILLIGGGIGVPPLYYLGKSLQEKEIKIISVLGYRSKDYLFYEEKFKALGETIIVTNDGSYGEKGFVTDILDKLQHFDCYFSCGPTAMLKAVTSALEGKQGYISIEERMACGIGACFACMIPTNTEQGYKKICSDGPVFSAQEVIL